MQWPYRVKPLILLRLTLADCTKSLPHPEVGPAARRPAGKCPETRGLQGARTRPWRYRRPVHTRACGQRRLLAGQAGPTARRAAMPVASRAGAMRNLSVTCLRDPSNPHGAGAFRLSIRSVASLLEVGKLSAIEVKHEKPKGG